MVTKDEFVQKYSSFTDEQLFKVYTHIDTYSEQAKQALEIVINKKGGLENFLANKSKSEAQSRERQWIKNETLKLLHSNNDITFIKNQIKSDILDQTEINDIVDEILFKYEKEKEDKEVSSELITKSFLGFVLASILGGIFWALQLIYLKVTFGIFIIGIYIICSGVVSLIAKKSMKNKAVIITTALSTLFSFIVGKFLYMFFFDLL